jgi:CHAD domain-containing protein
MAKAWKIRGLDASRSVKETLPKILMTRFNEMMSYEKGTLEGKDIEFLHDMRVSSRRLQAAMKIFRPVFPMKQYKKVYTQLRVLIRMLGEVRHFDVFISNLEKYKDTLSDNNKLSLDLLIIKQNSLRSQRRKSLNLYLKQLNRTGFNDKFKSLVTSI